MLNADEAKLSPDGQAVAYFATAANKLRDYFEGEVLSALPDFARRALEKELEALPALKNADTIPPLVDISLVRAERCAHDLLSMNYDGPASAYLRACIIEASDAIGAAIVASWSKGGTIIAFPGANKASFSRSL